MSNFVLESISSRSSSNSSSTNGGGAEIKENYSKVVLKKEMVMTVGEEEKRSISSMNLVQKRISEMGSKQNNITEFRPASYKVTSIKTTTGSPKLIKSNVFAPKPFKPFSTTNGNGQPPAKPSFSVKNLKPLPEKVDKTPEVPPRSSAISEPPKPVIPPKPRNLSFKKSPPKLKPKPARFESSKRDNNDMNTNGDEENEGCDTIKPFPKRFQSKSVSYPFNAALNNDYDKADLLQRRKSCSEFQDLIQKKGEIRERILSKIGLLREERDVIMEEKLANDRIGLQILEAVERSSTASSTEVDKVQKYLQEVEQITKLSVGLKIRLNRVQSLLERTDITSKEKELYHSKKNKLLAQITEAEQLQANTNRRGENIRNLLRKHLQNQFDQQEFDGFLELLVTKITELKEMDQRIKMGEEQLVALNDNNSLDHLSDTTNNNKV